MFAEKDKDLDGKLSFEEFCGLETKLEKAFKVMDKDGDGYISKVIKIIFKYQINYKIRKGFQNYW